MAIKGKRRARGRRVIAAPPRPPVMVRKPPFWRRPVTWIVVGVVAAAAIFLGVSAKVRSDAKVQKRDREIAAVRAFADELRAQLPDDVQTVPPNLLVVFPTLRQDMANLKSGDIKPAEARKKADEVATAAKQAADGIQAIRVETIVPAEFQADRNRFQDAKQFLQQSFLLYEDVSKVFVLSLGLKDDAQKDLISEAQSIMGRAGNLFDAGFRIVVGTLTRLGITTPIVPATPPPPVPSAIPTPTALPSETPSASPTETPSVSPSESAAPSESPSPGPSASP